MSKAYSSNSEPFCFSARVPNQMTRILDTSEDNSWLPQQSDPNYPFNPSENILTIPTEESLEAFPEQLHALSSRSFGDLCEALSPIKVSSNSNFNAPASIHLQKAATPNLRIEFSSLYKNNSEHMPSKKFHSACPTPSKRILKKNVGQHTLWSCQNLDERMGEKLGNKEKNKKDLREDFKHFIEFRKSLKKENGPTNFCQEMFKGFKISEVRSFLKSQIANA